MARKGQRQFILRNARAIVTDQDATDAATFKANFNAGRAGINGILQKFLEDGRRPLNNLAGGDLANERIGKGGN